MNITDEYRELLANMIGCASGDSPQIKVKEIRLEEESGSEKLLTVTFDVNTTDGCRELNVVTTASRIILRADDSGVSSYFPTVVETAKKKVAEMYDTIIERHLWIKRNYPTVDGALQAYSAMGGVYHTEYMGGVMAAVIVTLDPDGGYVPVILRAPGESSREVEMLALARILRHIEQRNKPSVS